MVLAFNSSLPIDVLPPLSGDYSFDITNLQNFLEHLFRPQIDTSFVDQIYLCIGIMAFLLIVNAALVLHRLLHGRAWVFKLWHVAGGTFVIPNAVFAFLLCVAGFGFVWMAYAILSIQHYRKYTFEWCYYPWKVLIWTPLWTGSWLTSFGLVSAFPDALTRKIDGSKQKRLILSPSAFNIACWGTPLLQLCSILPLSLIAGRHNAAAASDFARWLEDVRVESQQDIAETIAMQLRIRAMDLWLEMTKVYWYVAVIMTCWCAWAIVALLAYVPIGAHVLVRIRRQLEHERSKKQTAAGYATPSELETGVKLGCDPLGTLTPSSCIDLSTSRVYPAMREHPFGCSKSAQRLRTAEERLVRNLKRLHQNLFIQYLGVSAAIFCFFVASGADAVFVYDASRYGDAIRVEIAANLFAAWTVVVFASLTFFCIFRRSFDPSLSVDFSDGVSSPIAPGSVVEVVRKVFSSLCNKNSRSATPDVAAKGLVPCHAPVHSHCQVVCSQVFLISSSGRSTPSLEPNFRDLQLRSGCAPQNTELSAGSPTAFLQSVAKTSSESKIENDPRTLELYYATPFGNVPAVTTPAVRFTQRRSSVHVVSPTRQHVACCDLEELPQVAPLNGGQIERNDFLRNAFFSSFWLGDETQPKSSSLSKRVAVASSECPGHSAKIRRPATAGTIASHRNRATPHLIRSHSTSSTRLSRLDTNP